MSTTVPRYPWSTPWAAALLVLCSPEMMAAVRSCPAQGGDKLLGALVGVKRRQLFRVLHLLEKEGLVERPDRKRGDPSRYWWQRIRATPRGRRLASKFRPTG